MDRVSSQKINKKTHKYLKLAKGVSKSLRLRFPRKVKTNNTMIEHQISHRKE